MDEDEINYEACWKDLENWIDEMDEYIPCIESISLQESARRFQSIIKHKMEVITNKHRKNNS